MTMAAEEVYERYMTLQWIDLLAMYVMDGCCKRPILAYNDGSSV